MAFTAANTKHATSGHIGADFSATSAYSAAGEDVPHTLGQTMVGNDGTVWTFVLAGAAIAQFDCVAIDENYSASPITKALADAGHAIGFAQVAFSSGDYGWVARSGSDIGCNVLASCAADVTVYTSATAGSLDDTATSQTQIHGVRCVTADGGSGGSVEVIAVNPHVATAG